MCQREQNNPWGLTHLEKTCLGGGGGGGGGVANNPGADQPAHMKFQFSS